ncbi:hypothetical protein NYE69_12775 [Paenibacillus sp. FSL R5-0527]|uniref:hypothetical protein n=1 Tax=Paenibacillus sp. FSL R5-0527 TaxID=2975321 RepID=UPI00097A7C36|nr:hypothetical protein BK140_17020 [Paenibacillus macerans]
MADWKKIGDNKYRLIAELGRENDKRVRKYKEITREDNPSNYELKLLANAFEQEERLKSNIPPAHS